MFRAELLVPQGTLPKLDKNGDVIIDHIHGGIHLLNPNWLGRHVQHKTGPVPSPDQQQVKSKDCPTGGQQHQQDLVHDPLQDPLHQRYYTYGGHKQEDQDAGPRQHDGTLLSQIAVNLETKKSGDGSFDLRMARAIGAGAEFRGDKCLLSGFSFDHVGFAGGLPSFVSRRVGGKMGERGRGRNTVKSATSCGGSSCVVGDHVARSSITLRQGRGHHSPPLAAKAGEKMKLFSVAESFGQSSAEGAQRGELLPFQPVGILPPVPELAAQRGELLPFQPVGILPPVPESSLRGGTPPLPTGGNPPSDLESQLVDLEQGLLPIVDVEQGLGGLMSALEGAPRDEEVSSSEGQGVRSMPTSEQETDNLDSWSLSEVQAEEARFWREVNPLAVGRLNRSQTRPLADDSGQNTSGVDHEDHPRGRVSASEHRLRCSGLSSPALRRSPTSCPVLRGGAKPYMIEDRPSSVGALGGEDHDPGRNYDAEFEEYCRNCNESRGSVSDPLGLDDSGTSSIRGVLM